MRFETFSRSQMWSNKSTWEQELADLLCVTRVSKASIPASTSAVLPWEKDHDCDQCKSFLETRGMSERNSNIELISIPNNTRLVWKIRHIYMNNDRY